MSESKERQFRFRQILVSDAVYKALQALQVIECASCPDEVADIRLGKLLEREADIPWLIDRKSKVDKELRSDYREHLANKALDALPMEPDQP